MKKMIKIENNVLIATNFLESKKDAGNYPCYRHKSIQNRISKLKNNTKPTDLRTFGNVIAGAVQPMKTTEDGKEFGTLYSSFINITDMEFVLVPKLDNQKMIKLDLKTEFKRTKKRKIKLYK